MKKLILFSILSCVILILSDISHNLASHTQPDQNYSSITNSVLYQHEWSQELQLQLTQEDEPPLIALQ